MLKQDIKLCKKEKKIRPRKRKKIFFLLIGKTRKVNKNNIICNISWTISTKDTFTILQIDNIVIKKELDVNELSI